MKMNLLWILCLSAVFLEATELKIQINKCKNNNAKSCYVAGITLTTGKNAQNQEKKDLGLEYLRKACKYDEQRACDAMGKHYYKEKHFLAARPYLINSCKRKIVNACEGLGTIYRDGHDTKADDTLSREYYEKACDLGSKDACYGVAIIYRGGFGVKKSRAMEKSFYKKSCEAGSDAGCDRFVTMDNKDKGIEEASVWDKVKSFFN